MHRGKIRPKQRIDQLDGIVGRLSAVFVGKGGVRKVTYNQFAVAVWLDDVGILEIKHTDDNLDTIESLIGGELFRLADGTQNPEDMLLRMEILGHEASLTSSGWSPQEIRMQRAKERRERNALAAAFRRTVKAVAKATAPKIREMIQKGTQK